MLGPRHEIAHLQSGFYRNQYRKVLRWLIYSVIVMFLLIATILYFIFFQPTQAYYANTTEGKILNMPHVGTA